MRRKQKLPAGDCKWVAIILALDFIVAATGGAFFLF
jgi:hypothetical protein